METKLLEYKTPTNNRNIKLVRLYMAGERKRSQRHATNTIKIQHVGRCLKTNSKPIQNSNRTMDKQEPTRKKRTIPEKDNTILASLRIAEKFWPNRPNLICLRGSARLSIEATPHILAGNILNKPP